MDRRDTEHKKSGDRRQYIRHTSSVPLTITKKSLEAKRETRIKDIGFGGLSFVSSDFFDIGDAVDISFPLIDGARVIEGRVVWLEMIEERFPQQIQYGVQFRNPEQAEEVAIIEQTFAAEADQSRA